MNDVTGLLIPKIPKIILQADIRASIAMKEVARILTETEGKTTPDKNEEIFRTFMGVDEISTNVVNFFRKESAPIAEIFDGCVEATGLTDVLSVNHEKVRWIFGITCARVPKATYETVPPEAALRQAGEATGVKLNKKYGFPVHFMYGDSRVYGGPSNSGNKNVNLAYFFGYKEQVSRYS